MNGHIKAGTGIASQILQGARLPLAGAGVVWRAPGARRWAVVPLALNCLLYALIICLAVWLADALRIPEVHWEFWWGTGEALASLVNAGTPYIKWLIVVPLIAVLCYFSFTFVGMLIAAPFNDILSEKIESYITGRDTAGNAPLRLTLKATLVSLFSTLRMLLRQMLCALLCLPLLLIPVVGAGVMFVAMSYYAGLGFFDIGMARNFLRHGQKMAAAREIRWQIVGLGIVMQGLFLIPLAGLLLLPLGVAGGTLLYCRFDWTEFMRRRGFSMPEGFIPPNAVRNSGDGS